MTTRVQGLVYAIHTGAMRPLGFPPPPLFAVDKTVEEDDMIRVRLGLHGYGYVSVFEFPSDAEGPHTDVFSEHSSVRLESPDLDLPQTSITLNQEGQSVTALVKGGGNVKITYSPQLETRG